MNGEPSLSFITSILINEILTEILNSIKEGVTCNYIANIFNQFINENNIIKNSRIGYSFGIGFCPEWGDNTISIRESDNTILKEGICIHLIFGVGDNWGYQFSEAIVIHKNGPELLLKTPRILFTSENCKNLNILSNSNNYIENIIKYTKDFTNKFPNWNASIIKGNNKRIHFLNHNDHLDVKSFHNNANKTNLSLINNEFIKNKLLVKDESNRMNSKSFKILGVSYAVSKLISSGTIKKDSTLTTMTDGNHGTALAIIAKEKSLKTIIYVPECTIQERIDVTAADNTVFLIYKH